MRSFDCLSADCPILGFHLLEASAGTGKTFAIEHIIVRLLLKEIALEQILAVTFTRSAARDLKRRIRSNLQEALSRVRSRREGWEYLNSSLGVERVARQLEEAILAFDRCQIFTIHGFCHRMLQEFAFEADLGISLYDFEQETGKEVQLYQEAKKFVEQEIDSDVLCPEQMVQLLREYDTLKEVIRAFLYKKSEKPTSFFPVLLRRFAALCPGEEVTENQLLEEFLQLQPHFKKAVKGNFARQIKALSLRQGNLTASFRQLLREKGTLFSFLSSDNRKVKAKGECSSFLQEMSRTIAPLFEEAMNHKKILGCLQEAWRQKRGALRDDAFLKPDEILHQMQKALEKSSFVSCVRQKYRAVLIDEFQDTDPLQWEIFKNLFLKEPTLQALYLVGDPKQSIYRFRKADIYTYFEARTTLGPSALFSLNTNYRSSSELVAALNVLFNRSWLTLPKLGVSIPCSSVKAGSSASSGFSDGKGAVHFISARSFENASLPYAVQEIERLLPILCSPSSFAILVRDRYQAEIALRAFQARSIPAVARNSTPLVRTFAFRSLCELFEALLSPHDNFLRRKVALGPFKAISFSPISGCASLEEEGFISFCRRLLSCSPHQGEIFHRDLIQIIEKLVGWGAKTKCSLQGMFQFLEELKELEGEEGGERYGEAQAVQILTLHMSKGLEFDVVFALGLASRSPEAEEIAEEEEEKLRQLYVAMTRAKKRLYVPLPFTEKTSGSFSPIELFCKRIEREEGPFLSFLEKIEHVSWEALAEQIVLSPSLEREKAPPLSPPLLFSPSVSPRFLHSFTSLARPIKKEAREEPSPFTSHTLPKGVETGIVIHQILERLFKAPAPIWRDPLSLGPLIAEQLRGTALSPWQGTIEEMIWKALNLKIPFSNPFSLTELLPEQLQVEMEFLFSQPPHFVRGFIDLVFLHEEKFFFLDWKANWLGAEGAESLEEVMTSNDYWLQARLYAEALKRHVKQFYTQPFQQIFGGAIYVFLRRGKICYFKPELDG